MFKPVGIALLLLTTALPVCAQTSPKAAQLIQAAKAASGGAAWDHLVTWHEQGKVTAGGMTGTYEQWTDMPSLRSEGGFAMGPMTGAQGWDGKAVWSTDSSRTVRVETSREVVAQAIQDAYRGAFAVFTGHGEGSADYAGQRADGGKTYEAVRITPKGADPFEIWFDPTTHRIDREVQLTGGQPHTFLFSDWRRVGGIDAPFKAIDRVANNPKFDTVVEPASIQLIAAAEPDSRYAPPPPPADDAVWAGGATSVTVPMRLMNNHIYIDAQINGQPPRPFVFDTGATSVIDNGAAKALGVEVQGAMAGGGFGDAVSSVGLAKVRSVAIGGLSLPDQVFAAMDNSPWIAVEGSDSAGLLGYEFVKRAVLTVDYAHGTLTFTRPAAFQPPVGAVAVPLKFQAHIPMVDATLDGVPGEFEIDTGSRGALTVMSAYAEANHLTAKYHASVKATVGFGVGGPSRALLARAGELKIGAVTMTAPVTEISTDSRGAGAAAHVAGNIGGDILKRFTVSFDYGHQVMWLLPNPLLAQKEVFDRAGVWIGRAKDGGVTLVEVTPGGPAAAAGLVDGDEILAIDGQPAQAAPLFALRERFKAAPGTRLRLTVRGKAGERAVDLVLADQI